jgi:hypothetical protein
MAAYRCYLMDYRDRISDFIEFQSDTDEAAVKQAQAYANLAAKPFELWRGSQMIISERTRSGKASPSAVQRESKS